VLIGKSCRGPGGDCFVADKSRFDFLNVLVMEGKKGEEILNERTQKEVWMQL